MYEKHGPRLAVLHLSECSGCCLLQDCLAERSGAALDDVGLYEHS